MVGQEFDLHFGCQPTRRPGAADRQRHLGARVHGELDGAQRQRHGRHQIRVPGEGARPGELRDLLFGGAGADLIDGGPGSDTVSYAGEAAGVTVSLDGTAAESGQDTIEAVENVRGSRGDDEIKGDAAPNIIWGGRGDDTIRGAGGGDTMSGGSGADIFAFDAESGDVIITDFGGRDKIDLSAFGFDTSAFERHVTIEDEAFRIEDPETGVSIRVEVGIELDRADFIL